VAQELSFSTEMVYHTLSKIEKRASSLMYAAAHEQTRAASRQKWRRRLPRQSKNQPVARRPPSFVRSERSFIRSLTFIHGSGEESGGGGHVELQGQGGDRPLQGILRNRRRTENDSQSPTNVAAALQAHEVFAIPFSNDDAAPGPAKKFQWRQSPTMTAGAAMDMFMRLSEERRCERHSSRPRRASEAAVGLVVAVPLVVGTEASDGSGISSFQRGGGGLFVSAPLVIRTETNDRGAEGEAQRLPPGLHPRRDHPLCRPQLLHRSTH
jgi:hypothetical protein